MRRALTYSIAGLILALCASVSMAVTLDRHGREKEEVLKAALDRLELSDVARQEVIAKVASASAFANYEYSGEERVFALIFDHVPAINVSVNEGRKLVLDMLDTVALDVNMTDISTSVPSINTIRFSQYAVQPKLITRVVVEFNHGIEVQQKDGIWHVYTAGEDLLLLKVRTVASDTPDETAVRLRGLAVALSDASAYTNAGKKEDRVEALASRLGELIVSPRDEAAPEIRPVGAFTLKLAELETVLLALQADEVAVNDAEEDPVEEEEEPVPPTPRELAPVLTDTSETNKEIAAQRQELLERLESGTESLDRMGVRDAGASTSELQPRRYIGDPLNQLVSVDFRDTPLTAVVAILAEKGNLNVIAGNEIRDQVVTTSLSNVPLRQAMSTALRIHRLGLVEEEGIYYIRPYEEAIAADRHTQLVVLEHAKPADIKMVMDELMKGANFEDSVNVSAHDQGDMVVVTGAKAKVEKAVQVVKSLDVERRTLPTVTEPIKLNFTTPTAILSSISTLTTPEVGQVTGDERSRTLIVTDIPIVVEQIKLLVAELDKPVRQVAIDSMIVDVVLGDAAETGVDWLLRAVQRQSRRDAALGNNRQTGNVQNLGFGAQLPIAETAAGLLDFGILTGDLDWRGIIQAEVRNNDSRLISNPRMVTLENEEAHLAIAQEIPYVELTSTDQGGQQTSTEFKDIGTDLVVTPRVTHDNQILVKIEAKESFANGVFNGIPVEDKREVSTNALMKNGETIWLGGLRKNSNTASVRKVPVLGDIPVVNVLFRQNIRNEDVNELLIFLTCTVVEGTDYLTDREKQVGLDANMTETKVDAQRSLFVDMAHPDEMRDPIWRWRRSE